MKYYYYEYRAGRHSGRAWFLAECEEDAQKRLKSSIHRHFPFTRYTFKLVNVTPA